MGKDGSAVKWWWNWHLIESLWSAMSIQNCDRNNPFVTRNNLLSFHFSPNWKLNKKYLLMGRLVTRGSLFVHFRCLHTKSTYILWENDYSTKRLKDRHLSNLTKIMAKKLLNFERTFDRLWFLQRACTQIWSEFLWLR